MNNESLNVAVEDHEVVVLEEGGGTAVHDERTPPMVQVAVEEGTRPLHDSLNLPHATGPRRRHGKPMCLVSQNHQRGNSTLHRLTRVAIT